MERSRGACQNVSEERGFPRGLMQKEKWKNCGNSSAVTVMKLIDWKSSGSPFQKKSISPTWERSSISFWKKPKIFFRSE